MFPTLIIYWIYWHISTQRFKYYLINTYYLASLTKLSASVKKKFAHTTDSSMTSISKSHVIPLQHKISWLRGNLGHRAQHRIGKPWPRSPEFIRTRAPESESSSDWILDDVWEKKKLSPFGCGTSADAGCVVRWEGVFGSKVSSQNCSDAFLRSCGGQCHTKICLLAFFFFSLSIFRIARRGINDES